MERTLSIIKPDAFGKGAAGDIVRMFQENGFRVVASKTLRMSKQQAEGFYFVHEGRPFFDELTDFMSSGPVQVTVLEGEDAIRRHRDLMGPTNSQEAPEGTIRHKYGTDVGQNAVHGSDSAENAAIEVNYFFSGYELRGL